MPYKNVNRLAIMLRRLQATRLLKTGQKPRIDDLIVELAKYYEVKDNTIRHLRKRNTTSQASLALALKIARFFECQVEDIFVLDTDPEPVLSHNNLKDADAEKIQLTNT
ncbi:helix-turn-helix domain-containing protein [Brevibacillus reuszeri]|uniref:helix-turn-helix domain-containing protein n=1 Tax=Brevibacillus reuszeri TaxID=54915 RepID=UPI003D235A86